MTPVDPFLSGPAADGGPSARFARFATRMVLLYPMLWLVGLAPAFWVVLGAAGAWHLTRAQLTTATRLVLLVPALLLASLPIGLLRFGLDPGRVVSTTANLLIWIGVAALVNSASPHPNRVTALARAIVVVGLSQGALIGLSALLYPAKLPVPLLEPLLADAPGGISAFATNGLYYMDWLNGAAYRSQGIMGNATWNGAIGAVTILLGLSGAIAWRGRWRVIAILAIPAGLLSLQTSLSRSTAIALSVAVLSALWIAVRRHHPGAWSWITLAGALVLAWVVAFHLGALLDQFASINDERAGSAVSRGEIYATTIHYIQESPFPALGYGLKPKEDGLVASVATHSTYLGIVFRAGFIGAIALIAIYFRGLAGEIRRSRPLGTALMVFVLLWCIFEDIDGGHLVPLVLVLVFAGEHQPGAGVPPNGEHRLKTDEQGMTVRVTS